MPVHTWTYPGEAKAGKIAGVIVLKKKPAVDIRVFQDAANLAAVIKVGRYVKLDVQGPEETPPNFRQAVTKTNPVPP